MIIRGFLLVQLLDNLKYSEINFPPNTVDFFKSKENISSSIIPGYKFKVDPRHQIRNNNFAIFNAKPYIYNNVGGSINQLLGNFVFGLLI